MTKCLLWLVLVALSAAFAASAVVQESRAKWEEHRRLCAQPAPFFVHVVEPKMKAGVHQYGSDSERPAIGATTLPATQPAR
jgi:hypothetical protein